MTLLFWKNKTWRFTCFYDFSEASKKKDSWDLIRNLCGINNLRWVLGGDFNEILWNFEKSGGINRVDCVMQDFRTCLNDCGLKYLGYPGDIYTWCNRRRVGCQIFEHLDRFISNLDFSNIAGNLYVNHLHWSRSDHRAIKLVLNFNSIPYQNRFKARTFKFEEFWASNKNCGDIISNSANWNSYGENILNNLTIVSKKLGFWGRSLNNSLKNNIRD